MHYACTALFAALAALPFSLVAQAADLMADVYHPVETRHENDFVLPMPSLEGEQMGMVFARLRVPGQGYWGDEDRELRFGFAGAAAKGTEAVFEDQQRLLVGGSFSEGNAWYIVLGKYEVSIGQYIAMMGGGNREKGIEAFDRALGGRDVKTVARMRSDDARLRRRIYTMPMRWLRFSDVRGFLRAYNQWCFSDNACMAAMPRLGGSTGFFRLPTEDEWEYAARDGYAAATGPESAFIRAAPFTPDQAEDYAQIENNAPIPIGSLKPSADGIYDLYGNVQELTEGPFRTNLTQGKVGGAAARGGGFRSTRNALRASMREEVPLYARDSAGEIDEARNPETGFRLAIGSLAVPDPGFYEDVIVAQAPKARIDQSRTQVRRSTAAPVVQAQDSVGRIVELARILMDRSEDEGERGALRDIERSAFEAEKDLLREQRKAVLGGLRNGTYALGEFGARQFQRPSILSEITTSKEMVERWRALAVQDSYYEEDVVLEKEKLGDLQALVKEQERDAERHWTIYQETVIDAASYRDMVDSVYPSVFRDSSPTPVDRASLTLMRLHIASMQRGDAEPYAWRRQAVELFMKPETWK